MSRIGKKIIELPSNVEVKIAERKISVKGPKGLLEREIHNSMKLVQTGNTLQVEAADGKDGNANFRGLTRSLVNNMVTGVSTGYTKTLLLIGVGYRALVKGKELHLTLGYSHPVVHMIPEGIEIKVEKIGKNPAVVVNGIDKEVVGQTAADIRAYRKPEPYHGKGVRYSDEVIVTKVGKSSGKK